LQKQLGDLEPIALDPLAPADAAMLVEELFYGHGCPPTPPIVAAVLDAVGAPIPYFLQALVHHTLAERCGGQVDPLLVDRAYRRRLLDAEGNEFFRPFRLRERGYPDALRPPAAELLAHLARADQPVKVAELRAFCPSLVDAQFETLLAALQEDYDIAIDGERASLRSKVLRERWGLREPWLTEV
jgi:hypothetical protein